MRVTNLKSSEHATDPTELCINDLSRDNEVSQSEHCLCLQPDLTSLYLYDMTYLFILLANQTLAEGRNVRDGSSMFKRAIGISFAGTVTLNL